MAGRYHYDGTPRTGGVAATSMTGKYPSFSIVGMREMVVIDRMFVDDDNNRSRSYVEYVCRDMHTGETVHGVRQLSAYGGLDDGDDNVLRPAAAVRDGVFVPFFNKSTPAKDTDGDRVLVGFIEGSRQRAIILGVLTHRYSAYGATKADGERRRTTHKGTSVETKADGTYVITRLNSLSEEVTVTITPDGDVEIAGPITRSYRLKYSGDDAIELGEDPQYHVLRGEVTREAFNALVGKVNDLLVHVHTGNGVAPTGLLPDAEELAEDALSPTVKVR